MFLEALCVPDFCFLGPGLVLVPDELTPGLGAHPAPSWHAGICSACFQPLMLRAHSYWRFQSYGLEISDSDQGRALEHR